MDEGKKEEEYLSAKLMLRAALPIDEVNQVWFTPHEGICLMWVNIDERPDLQMMASRSVGDEGDCALRWFYANPGKQNMILGLRVEKSSLTFHLAFRVATYFEDLQAIAKFGRICVVPGPAPDNFKESLHALDVDQFLAHCQQGIAIQFDAKLIQELRTNLMTWGAQFAARS